MTHLQQDKTERPAGPRLSAPVLWRDFLLVALAGAAVILILGEWAMRGAGMAPTLVVLLVHVMAMGAVALFLRRAYHRQVLGWCNAVTMLRAALVTFLLLPLVAAAPSPWLVPVVAAVTLALDGLDGWLARRRNMVSRFGARFDVEVDAGFGLVLMLHGLAAGYGIGVMVLGLMRYAYVAAGAVWPWLNGDLPPRRGRKSICVYQLSVLIALQVPGLPEGVGVVLVWSAVLLLLLSFGRDIRWLWHRR